MNVRAVAIFLAWSLPACVLVFLFASQFFAAWSGVLVSVRPYEPESATRQAMVVAEDGSYSERRLPAAAVKGLDVPVDDLGAPPPRLPEGLPRTNKSRFSLSVLVVPAGGASRSLPTTSPRALGLAAVVWLILLGARNGAASGSPFRFERRPTMLPKKLPDAGQATAPRKPRPKKGPPPRRGRRR